MSIVTGSRPTFANGLNQAPSENIQHAFTVDVEDYFQVSGFEEHVSRDEWSSYESRVEGNTVKILDLLDETKTKGTFFILGWVAKEYPSLIREIAERGHEIGCHSFWHRLIYKQTQQEFREDLLEARQAIEAACGVTTTMFRAPSFSITEESKWALDILREEGFCVDSSINPIKHDRYGIPDQEPGISEMDAANSKITEFTPSISKYGRFNLPISGGGFFRLYPYSLTRHCIRRSYVKSNEPYMFYIHPWEVDPKQPVIRGPSALRRFRHRVNLKRTYGKLRKLLTDFRFGTVSQVIANQS